MPAIFYSLGILSFGGCAFFTYLRWINSAYLMDIINAIAFADNQALLAASAMTLGIVSAIFFSTGAIIETMRRRDAD